MAADIVEDVGLLEVIELVAAPDEASRRKASAGEIAEEDIVGNQAGHCDKAPPGGALEHLAQPAEIGDPGRGNPERSQPVEKLIAGPADQQPLLAFEKQPPDG